MTPHSNKNIKHYDSLTESHSVLSQVGYLIKNKYGDKEYNEIEKAEVIALQDGDLEIIITTKFKPENTSPYSLTKVLRGYMSIYKKHLGLDDKVKKLAESINSFVHTIVSKYAIEDIQLTYIPDNKDLIIIEHIHAGEGYLSNRILSDITSFADNNDITLAIKNSTKENSITNISIEYNKRFGFIESDGDLCEEEMLRKPNQSINENFSFNITTKEFMKTLNKKESIQDLDYKKKWYKKYIEIINSKEYKDRRKEEYVNLTLARKRINRDKERVGFAFVGRAKVVNG